MNNETTFFSNIAELIKKHRKMSGLTQSELAKLAGVGGKTIIFDIEHGKQTVQTDTLFKVCSALNIKIEFLSPLRPEEHAS